MRCTTIATGLATALLLTATTMAAGAAARPESRLVVRLYDATSSNATDLALAAATADSILRHAGLDARWVTCDRVENEEEALVCARALGATDLAIRLVRVAVPDHYLGSLSIGYSLVDVKAHAGSLATIYLDRVRWLATAADAEVGTVMGCAMAHEVGHLLLGTASHATQGLMRAHWSREDVQRHVPADWQFTRSDAARLRRAVSRRSPPAATNIVRSANEAASPAHGDGNTNATRATGPRAHH